MKNNHHSSYFKSVFKPVILRLTVIFYILSPLIVTVLLKSYIIKCLIINLLKIEVYNYIYIYT